MGAVPRAFTHPPQPPPPSLPASALLPSPPSRVSPTWQPERASQTGACGGDSSTGSSSWPHCRPMLNVHFWPQPDAAQGGRPHFLLLNTQASWIPSNAATPCCLRAFAQAVPSAWKALSYCFLVRKFLKKFFLIYLFVLGCAGSSLLCKLFPSCGKRRLLSSCGILASHHSGFCCEARAPGCMGFSSCGFQALEHGLGSCDAQTYLLHCMWDLPGPGMDHVSYSGRQILYHWATREALLREF